MTKIPYQKTTFLLSAARLSQLPADEGIEIAIVGRSNAGKSSVLNRLTQNKKLARVSKTPGRTQLINLFAIDDTKRIADLPGYGFAQVPIATKNHWEKLIDNYLRNRESLKALILVMDIRHPLKDFDVQLIEWCLAANLKVHILLNKCDKLSNNEIQKSKRILKQYMDNLEADSKAQITFQIFSAEKGTGVDEFKNILSQWYQDINH